MGDSNSHFLEVTAGLNATCPAAGDGFSSRFLWHNKLEHFGVLED